MSNEIFDCPPRMDDGRLFTSYYPRCFTNLERKNSYDYRQYMINNAIDIMEKNRHMKSCGPCMKPFNIGTMLPEESIVKCDKNTCRVVINDPNGLGQGRQDYELSDNHKEFIKNMEKLHE